MAETATLTLTLDAALRDRFLAAADAVLRPPEDVLRDLMRDFADGRAAADVAAIERALQEAEDPTVVRISHEDAVARLRRQRSDIAARPEPRRAG